jgi:hypothetical protein
MIDLIIKILIFNAMGSLVLAFVMMLINLYKLGFFK